MTKNLRRFLTCFATLAIFASLFTTVTASAAPPGTPPVGSIAVSPGSGTSTTPFTVNPTPAPANCPGDTATDGYTWNTFIAPAAIDPATITYNGFGPVATSGLFPLPLFSTSGSPITNVGLAASTGQIVGGPAAYNFAVFPANTFPAGAYNIGVACTLAGVTETYYATSITITPDGGGFPDWAQGAIAAAPVLDSLTPGDATLTAAFTPGVSDPAATSFDAIATPQGGGAAVTASGAGSPIVIGGLTNGTTYDVVVTATNSVGTSADSNTLSGTPALAGQPPVQNVTAAPGAVAGEIDVCWSAPSNAGTVPPVGYDVSANPADDGPFSVGSGTFCQTFTGLTAGQAYTFTVVATYVTPDFGTPVTVQAVPSAAQVLNQEITVTRPQGALILTQRCGVNGSLAAAPPVNAFPGFPQDPAIAASADQVGTSPDIDLGTPGVQVDPEFDDYPVPSPVTYPTQCGLDLGTAQFITSGALAGQYYRASGALNEVTVVDTRDIDAGWTVSGTMSTLVDGTESFSGNYVGWVPKVSSDTDPAGPGQYDQIVAAGPRVLPGDGVISGTGLGSVGGQVLAAADPGEGLGIAELDARVQLLIPASVNAGDFSGILALTVI